MTDSSLTYLRFRVGWVQAWHALWLLLAIAQVTQAVWFSRGAAYPASLGDGRFNQLVLEHGYQSLRGIYAWSSPAQFYPATNTLGYSDTHAGTLPIYAISRALGYSIEHAWQQWFVVVASLNALAAFRLLTALGVARCLRGPLSFAAVASVTMVWLAGTHPQMLPMFFTLFAWAELVRWSDDRDPARLVRAAGWIAWQFAAGPYLAFFGAALGTAVALVRVLSARPALNRGVERRGRRWISALAVFCTGALLAGATAMVYQRAVTAGAGRSLDEIKELAPRLGSWFTASPVHWIYPAGWPGHMANLAEQAWLSGFLPWLLLVPAIVVGGRTRRTTTGSWLLACAGGALLTALFFTRWGHGGGWIILAKWLEPLRAFRSSGRIAGLLHVVQIAAVGLLLTELATRSKRRQAMVAGLAALLVIEGIGVRQPATDLAVAAKRANAVIAAWRESGDRPVLAYAFAYTNQPEVYQHLDAWSAALRLHRATLNGYSGNWPATHHRFLWDSTVANARQLAAQPGLSADQVSIVERVSAADGIALGIAQLPGRQLAHLDDFDLQPSYWSIFPYLERHVIDGTTMYQFTPPAEVHFRLPDEARTVRYLFGFRPDAYTRGGQSDGGGVSWSLQVGDGAERLLTHEEITPLTNAADRGLLPRTLTLPAGSNRLLIMRTDTGPAGNLAWDFILIGQLHLE